MNTAHPWRTRESLALLTDFYELTMMAGYLKEDRAESRVCFEYFFRYLPPNAGFACTQACTPLQFHPGRSRGRRLKR